MATSDWCEGDGDGEVVRSHEPSLCERGQTRVRMVRMVKDPQLARDTKVGPRHPLVGLQVFLQMVLPSERFVTAGHMAGERLHTGVDPLVTGQLLVTSEGFPAAGEQAFERSLTW